MQARLNKIWQTLKTFHFWSTCCSFQKKKRRLLPFFQDFTSIFQYFPCLENCWVNFKTFSTIQDSVRTLGIDSVNKVWYFTSYTPLHPRNPTDPIHMQSLLAVSSRILETWSLWKRSSFKFMDNITNKQSCNSNTWTCWSPVTTEGMPVTNPAKSNVRLLSELNLINLNLIAWLGWIELT